MQDEIYDRYYQAGRADLHAGLDSGFRAIVRFVATTFNALHDIQFLAPWKRQQRCPDRTGVA